MQGVMENICLNTRLCGYLSAKLVIFDIKKLRQSGDYTLLLFLDPFVGNGKHQLDAV